LKFVKATALLTGLLFMLTPLAFGADQKIGVIDFQRVLKESTGGKAAKAEIEKKGKGYEQQLKDKGQELEKTKKKLEAEAMVMTEDVKDRKEREFRIQVMDFKEQQKKAVDDFKKYEAEVIQKIQKEVFAIVEQIGKQGGYTLILERGAVLYFPEAIDVTAELIRLYDKK